MNEHLEALAQVLGVGQSLKLARFANGRPPVNNARQESGLCDEGLTRQSCAFTNLLQGFQEDMCGDVLFAWGCEQVT